MPKQKFLKTKTVFRIFVSNEKKKKMPIVLVEASGIYKK